MPFVANARHTLGLVLASIGGLALFLGLGCLAVAVTRQDGEAVAGLIGCSAVSGILGGLLLWRGIVMRTRAIAAGSTMHVEQESAPVWTTRTEAAKPSFLRDKERDAKD